MLQAKADLGRTSLWPDQSEYGISPGKPERTAKSSIYVAAGLRRSQSDEDLSIRRQARTHRSTNLATTAAECRACLLTATIISFQGSDWAKLLTTTATSLSYSHKLLGYTEEDAQAAADWDPMFSDVYAGMKQHEWAIGWINLVAKDGVIKGVPGGEYKPGDELKWCSGLRY